MGRGHALGEGSQAPPGSEPIREPGQVTVAVEAVGVQTPGKKMEERRYGAEVLTGPNIPTEKQKLGIK